jgi:hypothetical protein
MNLLLDGFIFAELNLSTAFLVSSSTTPAKRQAESSVGQSDGLSDLLSSPDDFPGSISDIHSQTS